MHFKIGELKRSIAESFSAIGNYLTITNGSGYTDFNSDAERFFIEILNVTYDYALRDVNCEKPNFPAIDLADDRRRVCFQVTTSGTNEKFKETIRIFKKNKFEEKYTKLFFMILNAEHSITAKSDVDTEIIDLTRLNRDIGGLSDNDIDYLDKYIKDFLRVRDNSNLGMNYGTTYTLGNAQKFIEWANVDSSDEDNMRKDLKALAIKLSELNNAQRVYVNFLVNSGHTPKTGSYWDRDDHIYIPTDLEQQNFTGLRLFNSLKALDLVKLDDDYDQHGDERYSTAIDIHFRGLVPDFNYIAKIKSFLGGETNALRRVFINCDFSALN